MEQLNWEGLAIGASAFLVIGLFHPLVIKGEYYWGLKVNYAFAALAVFTGIAALSVESTFWSAILAIVAFSSAWSIKEVYDQQKRVERGWFPANPRRKQATTKSKECTPSAPQS